MRSLNKSCPSYVTSQFISKLQPHIGRPLVLQAHNVAHLEKAIEAARRIEHLLITSELPTPSPSEDSSSTSTVSHEIPQRTALVSSTSEQFCGDNRSSQEQRSCWPHPTLNTQLVIVLDVHLRRIRNRQKYVATLTDFSLQTVSKQIISAQLEDKWCYGGLCVTKPRHLSL